MTTPTAPIAEQPDRLSFHRWWRLHMAAAGVTTLTGTAALLTWLTVMQWHPETYLPAATQTGFRWWLMAVGWGLALYRLVSAVWDRTDGRARLEAGASGPIPVTPLGSSLSLLAVLLSTPLWQQAWTAVQRNDAGILATPDVGHHAALLAIPVLSLAVLAWGAIKGVDQLSFRMRRQQDKEVADMADLAPLAPIQ